jgi:hypothetical protein
MFVRDNMGYQPTWTNIIIRNEMQWKQRQFFRVGQTCIQTRGRWRPFILQKRRCFGYSSNDCRLPRLYYSPSPPFSAANTMVFLQKYESKDCSADSLQYSAVTYKLYVKTADTHTSSLSQCTDSVALTSTCHNRGPFKGILVGWSHVGVHVSAVMCGKPLLDVLKTSHRRRIFNLATAISIWRRRIHRGPRAKHVGGIKLNVLPT